MTSISCHPACLALPELPEADQQALTEDIALHGLIHPIVIYLGEILSGRHRQRSLDVLDAAGVEVVGERYVPYTGDDAWGFSFSDNVVRRSLNKSQCACLAANYWEKAEAEGTAIERQPHEKTRDAIGRKFRVNGKAVECARKMMHEAPAMFDAVHDGGTTLWQAKRDLGWVPAHARPEQPEIDVAMVLPVVLPNSDSSAQVVTFRKVTCPHCGSTFKEDNGHSNDTQTQPTEE